MIQGLGLTLTYQNLLFCRVPINFILEFIIGTRAWGLGFCTSLDLLIRIEMLANSCTGASLNEGLGFRV